MYIWVTGHCTGSPQFHTQPRANSAHRRWNAFYFISFWNICALCAQCCVHTKSISYNHKSTTKSQGKQRSKTNPPSITLHRKQKVTNIALTWNIKWIHYCHLWCCFIVTHYNNICQIYQPLVLINPCWYIFESDWSILEYQKYGSVVQVTSYLHMTAAAELRPLTADCARTRLPSGEGSAPRAAARNTRPGPWRLSAAHPLQWACSAPARWYEHFVSQISTLVLAQSR